MLLNSQLANAQVLPEKIITRIDPGRVEERIKPRPEIEIRAPVAEVQIPAAEKARLADTRKIIRLSGVTIQGSTVYSAEDFRPIYEQYLNKKISFADIQKIANAITVKYRVDGYLLTKAIVPVQRIRQGRLRIVVVEGYIDKFNIQGKVSKSARKVIESYGEQIKESRPLRVKDLERYTLLANDLPGIQVQSVISPSKSKKGVSDITFKVKQKRLDAAFDFNNYGTRYLGPNQFDVNVSANSIFGTADKVGVFALATPFNNDVKYIQGYYQRPLGSDGTAVNLAFDYTKTHPGFQLEDLDIKGESKHYIATVTHPFVRSRRQNLFTDLTADYIDSNSDSFLVPGATQPVFRDKIGSVRAKAMYDYLDTKYGINTVSLEVSQGLPNVGSKTSDQNTSRPGGHSDYTKVNMDIARLQALPASFSALLALSSQYAFVPLLSIEEFGFGGREFGRGYDPSEIIGDNGIAGKFELRWTAYPGVKVLQQLQLFSFYDAGKVWNKGSSNSQPEHQQASSAGAGISVNFTDFFRASFEMDKPLTYAAQTEKLAGHSGYGWREFFNLSAVF